MRPVGDLRLSGDVVVIATGSTANHPEDVPFDGDVVFALSTGTLPEPVDVNIAGSVAARLVAERGGVHAHPAARSLHAHDLELGAALVRDAQQPARVVRIVVDNQDHLARQRLFPGSDTVNAGLRQPACQECLE